VNGVSKASFLYTLLKQIGPKRIQNTIADFQINCNGHLIKIQSSIRYLAVDIYHALSGSKITNTNIKKVNSRLRSVHTKATCLYSDARRTLGMALI
jgi:hypothetical protein